MVAEGQSSNEITILIDVIKETTVQLTTITACLQSIKRNNERIPDIEVCIKDTKKGLERAIEPICKLCQEIKTMTDVLDNFHKSYGIECNKNINAMQKRIDNIYESWKKFKYFIGGFVLLGAVLSTIFTIIKIIKLTGN